MRSFAVMIAVEYLRFEMWIQQSGLLTADVSGDPAVTDCSVRKCIQAASIQTVGPIDIDRLESNILGIIGEVYHVLNNLQTLKKKYRIDSADGGTEGGTGELDPSPSDQETKGTSASSTLSQGFPVARAIFRAKRRRLEHSNRVSFFKKVSFGWALTDDTSDREKIAGLIKDLKYYNDALREMLPPGERKFNDAVVSIRALALSEDARELADVGNAARGVDGQLYDDIYTGCSIKAKRLQEQPASSVIAYSSMELTKERISKIEDMLGITREPHRELTAYFSEQSKAPESSTPVLVEFTTFDETLSMDESNILKGRIGQLCELLARLDRPSTLLLPLSLGFLQSRRTQFVQAYQLPEFADPHREALSLYSIIRPNNRSIQELKSKQLWPTLEQRYQLAAVLADGLLSLLNVDWVHKSLNSANIVMFHEKGSVHAVDLSRPQMMGFGVARPEKLGEPTIDARSLKSPLGLWQHPELRQGPHRRYERRYDIYSLGMILFEIGMWHDLHYFSNHRDTAFDLRQRVINICHSQLAHHMGEAYRDAVLMCIDRDDLWLDTASKDEGPTALLELLSWEVVRVLKRCSVSTKT
ncbi:hypothetical protein FGG08_002495 [Glutinoglossum americanum]|uniref:Protein kinase domain-containing protein n=1 Tax=Glutinoglossum americanum TaxID=1670608 RepID=A0A9P8L1L1_9PEZI|nr:hypothetical protein FGG08_002495 [Glutinoglossum americanum]